MNNPVEEWIRSMSLAWYAGEMGDYGKAMRCYNYAQEMIEEMGLDTPININPTLSMLRHASGEAQGIITPLPPSEDMVMAIQLNGEGAEEEDSRGMVEPTIDQQAIVSNLKYYSFATRERFNSPDVMVMSTGRVGSVSLFRLLERTNYLPYHSYFMQGAQSDRIELACRHLHGHYSHRDYSIEETWIKTRKAEWIGSRNAKRPMAMLNHMDTIYAPTYAQINPQAKFLFLRRDPEAVFKSFYSKDQWRMNQLEPAYCKFDPFRYRLTRYDMPVRIAWYIKFTEAFSRAVGEVYPERFIEISSDKLFAQDDDEMIRLSEFMGIDKDMAKQHFGTVYNEKAHKKMLNDEQIQAGLEAFRRAYHE